MNFPSNSKIKDTKLLQQPNLKQKLPKKEEFENYVNSFELSKPSTLLKETLILFWRRKKQFLVKQKKVFLS